MKRYLPLLFGLVLLVAARGVAQPPVRVLQAPEAEAPLVWIETAEGSWIEQPLGLRTPVETAPGAGVEVLGALDDGWIAAGTRPDPPGGELYLLRSRRGVTTELPPPPGREDLSRGQPVPVIDGGRLLGLIWLEGDRYDNLTVYAAAWTPGGWGEPEVVSPPLTGQQTGLGVAVLTDGSWLAAWAADDAEGDAEILWSRRRGGAWTLPLQLNDDNQVPDYGVAVTALDGNRALVVWNSYDGDDYRLRQARLGPAGGWEISELFGEKGSNRARFYTGAGEPRLLYRSAEGSAWRVREYGRDGAPGRSTAIPGVSAYRPVIDLLDPAGVRAVWPAPDAVEPAREAAGVWEERP